MNTNVVEQSKRIKVLPEILINQIAAGEVIERPASILKELLENSIDANSTMIRIYLEEGGITGIKVVDNGCGIHTDDLPLVCLQHATSKINNVHDLANINSLGFRGEALASIASVAKVNINSQQTKPSGTTIEVKDVFYNVPARRKFLRSSKTEFNYTQELFKRIALSNFSVGFIIYHNNKLIKNLPAVINDDLLQKEKRLIKLCGKNFMEEAINFNCSHHGIALCGWVTSTYDVASSNVRYLYINNRIVKDKLLQGAIKQATQKLTIQPSYCLYLNLDPALVDVNVHPTKQEVRFADPKIVYGFVYESILEVIRNENNCNTGSSYNHKSAITNLGHSQLTNASFPEYSDEKLSLVDDQQNMQQENIKLFSMFDNRYLIIEQKVVDHYYLKIIEVFSALKWLIKKQLQKVATLNQLALIIPERIVLTDNCMHNIVNLEPYIALLEKFSFAVDQIHHNVVLIKAMPDCVNRLRICIDYKGFLTRLLQINAKLLNELSDLEFINLILQHISADPLNLFTKNELVLLVKELIKENFIFPDLKEKQISELVTI